MNLKKAIKALSTTAMGLALAVSIAAPSYAAMSELIPTSDQVTLSTAKPGAGQVTATNGLNVRSGPSTSSEVLTALPYGTNFMIVERTNSAWDMIQYDTAGHYGYVSRAYMRELSLDWYCVVKAGGVSLNMRSGKGTSYGILASIPDGRSIPELTYTGSWDYVLWGNKQGYVSTTYISRKTYDR